MFFFHKNKTINVQPHQLDRLIEVNADGNEYRNEKEKGNIYKLFTILRRIRYMVK